VAAEEGRKMKRIISSVLALTLLTSLGLAGASCVPIVEAKTGTIEVRVTDAPPSYGSIEEIWITVVDSEEGIMVHKAVANQEQEQQQESEGQQNQGQEQEQQQEQQGEGEWIPISITGDNPFELLELKENGVDELLGWADVPAGKYTQIRMTIEKVEVIFEDETDPIEAKLPSGKLKFVRPFNVIEGVTTILLFDFNVDKSVVVTGQGKVIVKPVVKLSIQQGKPHQLASVEGTISAVDTEEPDLSVSIIPTDGTEDDTIVLNVNLQQTEITLDDVDISLNELAELVEEEDTVTATALYYLNNLKVTQIDAMPPP
jgi:hypothetical protein